MDNLIIRGYLNKKQGKDEGNHENKEAPDFAFRAADSDRGIAHGM